MNTRDAYTLGFTLGYAGTWFIICAIAYALLMPFGYGYVSAEIAAAYSVWCTINSWDALMKQYQEGLQTYQ